MKWYLVVFTREKPVDLASIHVPGLAEWLEPQYDPLRHREFLGAKKANEVFETFAQLWWVNRGEEYGIYQPLRMRPEAFSTVIRAGFVDLLKMEMAILPEHKAPEIDAYRSDESEKLRLKAWEPPEEDTEGRWLGIHAMQECDGFAEAIQEMDKMHAECADAIDIQNVMRVKRKEAQLHEWYDELREYVRREHGQEMPQAQRDKTPATHGAAS
jgi:hypothetical protein